MMGRRHQAFSVLRALAVLALCLRVVVPVGYMPASIASGWYLQWCPEGLPVEVVERLFADEADGAVHTHAHHHNHPSGEQASPDAPVADGTFTQCDLSAFSSDFAPPEAVAAPAAVARVVVTAPRRADRPRSSHRLPYRSRAPPVPTRSV